MSDRWARPGEPLEYMQRLQQEGRWPPGRDRPAQLPGDQQLFTSFLIIPAVPGDNGQRPKPGTSWLNSPSLQLLNTSSAKIEAAPRKSASYSVVATVQNLGDAPVVGAFIEFLVQDGGWIDNELGFRVGSPEDAKRWLGVLPVSLKGGGSQQFVSPRTFKPMTNRDLTRALVVRVHEPLGDRMTSLWDSWKDAHIARRDLAPDFAGIWSGAELRDGSGESIGTVQIRIDRDPGMKQKAALASDGSYPTGDFECKISIEALPNLPDRPVQLVPTSGVQYSFGSLSWVGFSTNNLDPHATVTVILLRQDADGERLQMETSWGPEQTTDAGSSHALLSLIQPL